MLGIATGNKPCTSQGLARNQVVPGESNVTALISLISVRGARGFLLQGLCTIPSVPVSSANLPMSSHGTEEERSHRPILNRQLPLTVSPEAAGKSDEVQEALGAGLATTGSTAAKQKSCSWHGAHVPGCHSCPSSVSHQPDPFSSVATPLSSTTSASIT